jgi:serine/threonine protein kinase
VKIYGVFWNTPEGCVSIVMQMLSGGSLQNLLESVGVLPQQVVQQIGKQILRNLKDVHSRTKHSYGALCVS